MKKNYKISIYQKNINTPITKDQKEKILTQKSDFLIFPEFFPHFLSSATLEGMSNHYKTYLDSLLEISEYYNGTIIGGSLLYKEGNRLENRIPIVSQVQLIDHYAMKNPDENLKNVEPGNTDNFFMMNGLRFCIAAGNEIFKEEFLQSVKSESIQIIFNPAYRLESTKMSHTEEISKISEFAKSHSLHIIRVSGIGKIPGQSFIGLSLYATPNGVNWKIAETENQKEIIKTVAYSV